MERAAHATVQFAEPATVTDSEDDSLRASSQPNVAANLLQGVVLYRTLARCAKNKGV